MVKEEKPDSARGAESGSCFHCGLPVPLDLKLPPLFVLAEKQKFCCAGCHAVCETIVDAGLTDYYKYRKHSDIANSTSVVPDILKNLEIYDRPEIQKGFVVSNQDWSEAALVLEDIRCSACLWLNERHLRHQAGVLDVVIDSTTQRMRVRWDPKITRLSDILKAIADIGYIAHPYDARHNDELNAKRKRRSIERLIFAGLFGMMVMNFSFATYVMGGVNEHGQLPLWESIGRWMSVFITTLLLAYPAQDFWIGMWRDLKLRRLGMDVPIVVGLSVAFLGSVQTTLTGRGEIYFDSIAMFIFFVLLARYFETKGKVRAMAHMDHLSRAIPQLVYRRKKEGADWDQVSVLDLCENDIVRVLPGETVPVDGIIFDGKSSFNEALITGESLPVVKASGDSVIAGSINGDQPVFVAVQNAGQETALDTIRRLVERGMEKKPRSAQLAERVSRVFVVAILLIALVTGVTWYFLDPQAWLSNTIAVLIVTCPCALALATPVALAVSAGRLVEMGVLPLKIDALESLARADVAAFDKTGTLTKGQPELLALRSTGLMDTSLSLKIAAAISSASEHPLAKALKKACPEPGILIEEAKNVPGEGILAKLQGHSYSLGRLDFVQRNLSIPVEIKALLEETFNEQNSLSVLADEKGIQAIFSFSDNLRPGARQLIERLKDQGLDALVILSGDTRESVERVANTLEVANFQGGMLPADKLAWVLDRQAEGRRVLMFGDGINDAPTLASADVSISLTGATDLAHISSDFILLGDDLSVLAKARLLAIKTQANIRQNMSWAVSYNLLAVPFAALGFVPPWLAAIGMSGSSLFVVVNALRLKRG